MYSAADVRARRLERFVHWSEWPLALLALVLVLALASPASASKGGSSRSHSSGGSRSHSSSGSHSSGSSKSSGGSVHVRSYTKKDGTHVEAHTRSSPHASTKTESGTSTHSASTKSSTSTKGSTSTSTTNSSRKSQEVVVGRTADGKIARSEEAKRNFMKQTGYPNGRQGYVIDHIKPLACGGLDAPSNMQWQTVAEAKAKDKTERLGCH